MIAETYFVKLQDDTWGVRTNLNVQLGSILRVRAYDDSFRTEVVTEIYSVCLNSVLCRTRPARSLSRQDIQDRMKREKGALSRPVNAPLG